VAVTSLHAFLASVSHAVPMSVGIDVMALNALRLWLPAPPSLRRYPIPTLVPPVAIVGTIRSGIEVLTWTPSNPPPNPHGGGGSTTGPSNSPLYCSANVISAMGKIWAQSSNGTSGAEASFRVDGTPSNYNIVFSPFTNQRSSQSLTILPGTTFAIFHVHPNTGSWQPSTPQNNYEGNGLW
jgi:hypothetical protein